MLPELPATKGVRQPHDHDVACGDLPHDCSHLVPSAACVRVKRDRPSLCATTSTGVCGAGALRAQQRTCRPLAAESMTAARAAACAHVRTRAPNDPQSALLRLRTAAGHSGGT